MDESENVSLKEFFEAKIDSLERETILRFDALDKALELAREDAKEKYEHLNKLRTDVEIDRGILVRKDSCKQAHDSVNNEFSNVKKEIGILREAKSQIEGRAVEKGEIRIQSNWSTGLTVVASLSIVSIILMVIHLVIGK